MCDWSFCLLMHQYPCGGRMMMKMVFYKQNVRFPYYLHYLPDRIKSPSYCLIWSSLCDSLNCMSGNLLTIFMGRIVFGKLTAFSCLLREHVYRSVVLAPQKVTPTHWLSSPTSDLAISTSRVQPCGGSGLSTDSPYWWRAIFKILHKSPPLIMKVLH